MIQKHRQSKAFNKTNQSGQLEILLKIKYYQNIRQLWAPVQQQSAYNNGLKTISG